MLSGRCNNSHRCRLITVYVSCCNAQMNLIVETMTCTCIVMHLSICQLLTCYLFTQHVSYLLWRDTTSELWTPVHSFTSNNTIYYKHCSLHFLQANIIFHTIRLILCFQQVSEIDNHTVKLRQSILVVLCAGSMSTGAVDNFRCDPISYWFDNLGFLLRETCCYTHHTFLLGSPNERVNFTYHGAPRSWSSSANSSTMIISGSGTAFSCAHHRATCTAATIDDPIHYLHHTLLPRNLCRELGRA